jgi:hypothetical protein
MRINFSNIIQKSPDFLIIIYPFLIYWSLDLIIPIDGVSSLVFMICLSIVSIFLTVRIYKRGDVQLGKNGINKIQNKFKFYALLVFIVLFGVGNFIALIISIF